MGLSLRAYARHRGVSHQAVSKAVRTGRITQLPDGTIDPERADKEWAARTDPALQKGRLSVAAANALAGSMGKAAPEIKPVSLKDPDQQRRLIGEEEPANGPGEATSYVKARTLLTVYAAQDKQIAVQKKKGALVDRARAETLVFRLAREARDVWVTWPGRVAALMAAEIMAEVERQSGASVTIETAIMQRVLEAHVREQLDALADLRVSLA
jgi:hypothetical protein